jgi:hypothetical protein
MRIATLLAAFCLWVGASLQPAAAQAPDHAPFDRLLSRHVVAGADGLNRVNYAGWAASSADRAALDGYIATLERTRVSTLPRADQWAFWANLYNAVTLDVVLDRYPVRSIRDIRPNLWDTGPWRAVRVTVEGRRLSLDNIEHDIMRPTFRDPRVHYSVNCASVGCPNLLREAFRGDRLEAQLNAAARAFINSDRGVRITAQGLQLSSIYQWFAVDFGDETQLRAHLAQFAPAERAAQIRSLPIARYGYDWALNDTASRRR